MKIAGSDPHLDPSVRGMGPRIQIRIHTNMSWIRNTAVNYNCACSDLDALVDSLNPRGLREGELRDRIIAEREGLDRRLGNKRSAPTRLWLAKAGLAINPSKKTQKKGFYFFYFFIFYENNTNFSL
jgi:hypothetical protein